MTGRIEGPARKELEHRKPLEVNVDEDAIKRLIAYATDAKTYQGILDLVKLSSSFIKKVGNDRAEAFDTATWFDHLAKDLKDGRTVEIIPLKDRNRGYGPNLELNSSSFWTCIFTWERLEDLLQEIFPNSRSGNEIMGKPAGVRVDLENALRHDRTVVLIPPKIQRQE